MTRVYRVVTRWWDWRTSARARLVSLMTVWALVFGFAAVVPLLPVLGIARTIFSGAQLFLNRQLARRSPIGRRDRWDWLLLGLAFLGAVLVSAVMRSSHSQPDGAMLLPVLLPYSVLQLRSYRRSLAAHRSSTAPGRYLSPLPAS